MTDPANPESGTPSPDLAPPTMRAFLISDVRGYTRFTAEHGDMAAAQVSELFLGLCREVISSHGGDVFGSAGDQALAAFSSAGAALQAAIALQSRLSEEQEARPDLPLLAGIGLDAGESIQVGTDYRGNAINRAARLCSIAGGGEIFSSDVVITLARLTDGMAVVDRGEVTLKGLTGAVRVIQIGRSGTLPADLPPLQPILVTHPTNLPDEPTPFIGRSGEITEITSILGEPGVRLLTLLGPGGTGKTRLALQVGMGLLYSFRDGVFFCDLSPLSDATLVVSTIATTLGVAEAGSASLLDVLTDYLKEKYLMLVLDNCEQVIDAAPAIGTLLDNCREVTVLATSRVPLHLAREREYAVRPLAVPDPAHLPPLDQLQQYEAVALFIERAGAARHGFVVTNETAPAVAQICYRLDGLPLAIELAAARIKLFPPAALLQRLEHRLTLLTGGARDRPSRQQTLRGAIDWSYSLLTAPEQTLFARLSVFSGGCGFEAAEIVCSPDGDLDLLEGMTSLVEQSLVRQEGEEEPRFRMLETIREYAAEKLTEGGDEKRIRDGHAEYVLAFAEEAEAGLNGPDRAAWLQSLDEEVDNLRDAMGWLLGQEKPEEELQLMTAAFQFWEIRGHWLEALRWLDQGLATIGDGNPALQAKALDMGGVIKYRRSAYDESVEWLQRGLEHADRAGDRARRASILSTLGLIHNEHQRYDEAGKCFEESLLLARAVGKGDLEATALSKLGALAHTQGQWGPAKKQYLEALTLLRSVGALGQAITTEINLGSIALYEGNQAEAQQWFAEGLAAARELGDRARMMWALGGLSDVAIREDKLDDAKSLMEECLTLAREVGAQREISEALVSLGILAAHAGHLDEARDRLSEGLRLARNLGLVLNQLSGLNSMAALADAERQEERAVRLKAAELAERARTGFELDAFNAGAGNEMCDRLRASLGEERFSAAWAEGERMNLGEAVAYALEEKVQDAPAPPQNSLGH